VGDSCRDSSSQAGLGTFMLVIYVASINSVGSRGQSPVLITCLFLDRDFKGFVG
jgi:hypothetical protein